MIDYQRRVIEEQMVWDMEYKLKNFNRYGYTQY